MGPGGEGGGYGAWSRGAGMIGVDWVEVDDASRLPLSEHWCPVGSLVTTTTTVLVYRVCIRFQVSTLRWQARCCTVHTIGLGFVWSWRWTVQLHVILYVQAFSGVRPLAGGRCEAGPEIATEAWFKWRFYFMYYTRLGKTANNHLAAHLRCT